VLIGRADLGKDAVGHEGGQADVVQTALPAELAPLNQANCSLNQANCSLNQANCSLNQPIVN
jgi:hypothetical protein